MKNLRILILLILPAFAGCNLSDKKIEEKTTFPYRISVTAPKEYAVEVHRGYLNNADGFISAIPKAGIERSGWTQSGSYGGLGANQIPSHMDLTWVSYAEKKFWKADVDLPADKILALFQKGYTDLGGYNAYTHKTYGELTFGLAPGGVVVAWLRGRFFSTEVGRFQAKDTVVKKDDFRPIPIPEETQEEYYELFFKSNTTPEVRANIKKNGFPYGLWDKYRIKYNWRLRVQFYKTGDKQILRYNTYVNGEQEVQYDKELSENPYLYRPVPYSMDICFTDDKAVKKDDFSNDSEIKFDEKELMTAFEELAKNNKDQQIELLVKVDFQYTGVSLKLVAGNKEIPLLKSTVKMHRFR